MEHLNSKILTVLEINELVREVVRTSFPASVWVSGEIQDYNNKKDKPHVFFNFAQKGTGDTIMAQAPIVIFESVKTLINRRLRECAPPFELKDGIEVQFLCRIDFYAKSGRYQLVVADIEPAYTLGKAAQNRQKIIEELRSRGLLEKNKDYPLSEVPLRIGLITSFDSAAYHDFTNELKTSGYAFKIFLYNCRMQGEETALDVVRAIKYFDKMDENELDAVVITRGGGSTADLSFFDNKKIAEEVAGSHHVIISALGHEINTTITDLVAHTSLKTPTKAAQFLVERTRAFVEESDYFFGEITLRARRSAQSQRDHLKISTLKINGAFARYFAGRRGELSQKYHVVLSYSKAMVLKRKELEIYLSKTTPLIKHLLEGQKKRLDHALDKLQLLDPKNILRRGYSITRKHGRVVKNIQEIKEGDILKTTLYNGVITSKVEKERNNG